MKRTLLYLLSVVFVVVGIFLLLQLYNTFKPQQTGALQVSANVESDVYLDGEHVGTTPFCRGDISICSPVDEEAPQPLQSAPSDGARVPVGEHTIKIAPKETSLSPYVVTVDVLPGVMTAVDRTFLPDGLSSSYFLTLEEKRGNAGIFVQSIPSNAVVSIDGVSSGVTPYRDDDISASEHVLEIQKDGFAKKTIRVRTVDEYLLVVNVILGASSGEEEEDVEVEEEEDVDASESAELDGETVTILDTPTGFLRVRSGPGVSAAEVTTVDPGDTYPLLSENNGWYEIQLDAQTSGWISSEYADKTTDN